MSDVLQHYGILMKSGRYPWGSGDNPHQRNRDFLSYVDDLKRKGLSDVEIARGAGITTTDLRAARSVARNEVRQAQQNEAMKLKEKGMSTSAIGRQMGINESSVRALLNPSAQERADILISTSNMLRAQVDKQGTLDIGPGVNLYVGVSKQRMDTAVNVLTNEGYNVFYVKVPQLGTTHETNIKVLAPPGVTFSDVMKNRENIGSIKEYSEDGGRSFYGIKPPKNLSSKRVMIKYADDGGAEMDGVIQLRRGVDDISLGKSQYAQVRIMVDKTHYIKGMAMYSDKMPDGVDVIFNTNKANTGKKLDALKKLVQDEDGNIDPDNPFGAVIKPGGQRGVLNIVNEEGDWGRWSKNLSSQMLSKQSPTLAKSQLDLKFRDKQDELDEIMKLTNPAVKKKLLESFADGADSSAVHLKAAALKGQGTHAILPINSVKDTEIYAPNYRNGDKVVLIRYPHGGKFEIPELTVNNRNAEARSVLKAAKDAVGINSKVAARLSGADFDGDTVLVIPNNDRRVKTQPALKELKNFDPKSAYPPYPGMKPMSARTKQLKMGDVSNLITDMTIKGANDSEIARAVKHSMVVIDAEKWNLNWRQSAKEMGIAELKAKYQGSSRAGAATLISRASAEVRIAERKNRSASKGGPVNTKTGAREFELTGETYVNRAGRTVIKTTKAKRMEVTSDAFSLVSSSGTLMEKVYATHANKLKDLANKARLESVKTKAIPYSPSAKKAYEPEVKSLNAKLNRALMNKPLERKAQLLANAQVKQKTLSRKDLDNSQLKKIKSIALAQSRARTGAKKPTIDITPKEWNAIQSGAISNNMLTRILNNTDLDLVRQFATPRDLRTVMTDTKMARAQAMIAAGYTQAEAAEQIGVPVSTLNSALG